MFLTQFRLEQLPHHDGSTRYVTEPPGGAAIDAPVTLRLDIPAGFPQPDHVFLRTVIDGEAKSLPANIETGTATITYVLSQPVTRYRWLIVVGNLALWLNQEGCYEHEVTDAGDFRIIASPPPPDWVQDTSVYQIFPDRFARDDDSVNILDAEWLSQYGAAGTAMAEWATYHAWAETPAHGGMTSGQQYFGGTIGGITRKLEYLADLGVGTVYLTPFFTAGSTHRYDASTFFEVDPVLGGAAAMNGLVAGAHEHGMHVMGDITTNHTGHLHEWFRAAQASQDCPEYGYYTFRDWPTDYECWLGVDTLPKLDYRSDALRTMMYSSDNSVITHWLRDGAGLETGMDGWRVDVANMTARLGNLDMNGAIAHDIAVTMRDESNRDGRDRWLLAEHFHDAGPDLHNDGWHGVMNYAGFTRPLWAWLNPGGSPAKYLDAGIPLPQCDGIAAAAALRAARAGMPWRTQLNSVNPLDSHDSPRFRTVVSGNGDDISEAWARNTHRVGLAAQIALPGVPMIFAGDELGLRGEDGENSRTPMPWHDEASWCHETLGFYRELLALRKDSVALRRGGLRWLAITPDAWVILREHGDERVIIHLARDHHEPLTFDLENLDATAVTDLSSGVSFNRQITFSAAGPVARFMRLT